MKSGTIWISYDLGVQGDYERLYSWLDAHDAKECGDSLAVLEYNYEESIPEELEADLKKAITVEKRTRVYIIYRDRMTNKNKGKFIFGGRRAAPWTGYAPTPVSVADDEI